MRIVLTITLLAASVWLVGNLVLGVLVAPALLTSETITRAQGGLLFGALLRDWIAVVDISVWLALVILLALSAGYLLKLKRWGLMLATILVLSGLSGVHVWSRVTIHEVGQQPKPSAFADPNLQLLPDPQHAAFASLHRRSETLFAIETLLLALVVLATAVAVSVHRPEAAADGKDAA